MLITSSMDLSERFRLYQFQQTDKGRKGASGSDDEMNFISMVEYQSLETNVRKYHVLSLQEIREFWQGVRNGKTKDELSRQVGRIASLTKETKKLYSTLIKRFPNSSIVLALYARFTAVVLSDRDFARELNEAAKDNEQIAINNQGDNVSQSDGKSMDRGFDKSSVGSSNTSERAKAALMLKKKREMMEERLDSPIKGFLRNSNIFTLFFVLLMAAATSLSYLQIYLTNDALQNGGFSSLYSRFILQRLHLHFRKLTYYKGLNDTYKYNYVAKDLVYDLQKWRKEAKPLYMSGPGTLFKTAVKEWDGQMYHVSKMNAMELTVMVEQYSQRVNETVKTFFDNKTEAMLSPEVRFMFDNSVDIMDLFTRVRREEIRVYQDYIMLLRTMLVACVSSIGILAFIFSLLIPFFSYSSFKAR
jgi:hypothetical protein